MDKTVLLITGRTEAEEIAAVLSEGVNAVVEVASSRRAALALLRRRSYFAVVLDASMAAAEVTTPEMIWCNAGQAVPLEIALDEFRAVATMRLLRHVLQQCDRAREAAREDAATVVEEKLRSAVTGLLLQSELLLRDSAATPGLREHVRQIRDSMQDLRIGYARADARLEQSGALHSAILQPSQVN